MKSTAKEARKKIISMQNLELYSYFTTQNYKKTIKILDFKNDFISKYKEYKKEEKELKELVTNCNYLKKTKKMVKLT